MREVLLSLLDAVCAVTALDMTAFEFDLFPILACNLIRQITRSESYSESTAMVFLNEA